MKALRTIAVALAASGLVFAGCAEQPGKPKDDKKAAKDKKKADKKDEKKDAKKDAKKE